jgi:hypothetical protein
VSLADEGQQMMLAHACDRQVTNEDEVAPVFIEATF